MNAWLAVVTALMKRFLLQKVSSRDEGYILANAEIKPPVQQRWFRAAFVIARLVVFPASEAANTSYSGSKGGSIVARETFTC
ncbi:hypothetical protein AGR1C_pAt20133 [Agrobacterium fabacearum TT111]|nr:hypothetical protein AGR1C_pAt20133 [Agrobacterium fabacearum TT111]